MLANTTALAPTGDLAEVRLDRVARLALAARTTTRVGENDFSSHTTTRTTRLAAATRVGDSDRFTRGLATTTTRLCGHCQFLPRSRATTSAPCSASFLFIRKVLANECALGAATYLAKVTLHRVTALATTRVGDGRLVRTMTLHVHATFPTTYLAEMTFDVVLAVTGALALLRTARVRNSRLV